MTITRDQLCAAMLDYGECSKAVPFDFKDELGIIESRFPLPQRHWLEWNRHLVYSEYQAGMSLSRRGFG